MRLRTASTAAALIAAFALLASSVVLAGPSDQEVQSLIAKLGDEVFKEREKAHAKLLDHIRLAQLSPAQVGMVRIEAVKDPRPPNDVEIGSRCRRLIDAWVESVAAPQTIRDAVRVQQTEVNLGGVTYSFGDFYCGNHLGAPVQQLTKRWDAIRKDLDAAETGKLAQRLTDLRDYVQNLNDEDFGNFQFCSDRNLSQPVTRQAVLDKLNNAISLVPLAINLIQAGTGNVNPPPRAPVPVPGPGPVGTGKTFRLDLSGAFVSAGTIEVFMPAYERALSVAPPGWEFVGSVFAISADDTLAVIGSVTVAIEYGDSVFVGNPVYNPSQLRLVRTNGQGIEIVSSFVNDQSAKVLRATYSSSGPSGVNPFGDFALVQPMHVVAVPLLHFPGFAILFVGLLAAGMLVLLHRRRSGVGRLLACGLMVIAATSANADPVIARQTAFVPALRSAHMADPTRAQAVPAADDNDPEDVTDYATKGYARLGIKAADVVALKNMLKITPCKPPDCKPLYVTQTTPMGTKIRDLKIINEATGNLVNNPDALPAGPGGAFPCVDCDRPAWLSSSAPGNQCYGNSFVRKWVLAANDPPGGEIKIVLLCRHNKTWTDDLTKFDDIAMIMHNDVNGETLWFQALGTNALDGTNVPAPHDGAAARAFWKKPSETANITNNKGCVRCHDNGPWMNSRWMEGPLSLSDRPKAEYRNGGLPFLTQWAPPTMIVEGGAGLGEKDFGKSCTSCHNIGIGRTTTGEAGTWTNWTTGSRDGDYPPESNVTPGRAFKMAYWMPAGHKVADTPGTEDQWKDKWKDRFKKHVDLLVQCGLQGGKPVLEEDGTPKAGDPCQELKRENAPQPPPSQPLSGTVAGVHLYADTNMDGNWDYQSTAPVDTALYLISPGTPVTIGWSTDEAHSTGYVVATFPPGVAVNNVRTSTNWLLSETPQTIGTLTVPGLYSFQVVCADPDSGHTSTAMTFQIPGMPPTLLFVKAIVNGVASGAFDYPTSSPTHITVAVHDTDTVHIGWAAFGVDSGTTVLSAMSGGPSEMNACESGVVAVPLISHTTQMYRLTGMGTDGLPHEVEVTLDVHATSPAVPSVTKWIAIGLALLLLLLGLRAVRLREMEAQS